ncbi:MAG: COX15/CtaA family protein [Cytophagales bacterium]|nr:COX15/CtaA family protein [Cytophagales bacterium]MDW8383997.1 COX15/CtaA family protein [Flammeovirgaceae bacterium]
MSRGQQLFRRFGVITVIAVYMLILVGGIVRSTGSGMGCPDWPKCFGQYIPPTHVSQLPENYKEIFAEKRRQKNVQLASFLQRLGYREKAEKILHDPTILIEQDFHPLKTWIEYINRLIGALIGIFILITAFGSLAYWKTDVTIPVLAWCSVFLVLFQAWIGAFVVSTNLIGWMVTLHMILALLLVSLLLYTLMRSYQGVFSPIDVQNVKRINGLFVICLIFSVIQIVLGTQVREKIDVVANLAISRNKWVESVGMVFYIHRSFSLLVLILNGYLVYELLKNSRQNTVLLKWSSALGVIIVIEIVSGAIMAYFAIPAFMQPLHLWLANIMFGVQFVILMITNYENFFLKQTIQHNLRKNA